MSFGNVTDWCVFAAVVLAGMAADLVVAKRRRRSPTHRDALKRSVVWIGLGVLFGGWIALRMGGDAGIAYLTAYLLEKSLSVDNLFLFVLIFTQTGIPQKFQFRVLFWGVAGALVMRAVMIAAGVYLLERFHWVNYIFAAILLVSAWRMLFAKEAETKLVEASCSVCTSWVGRILPIRPYTDGPSFFVRDRGRLLATPLLVALVVIETTDLVFAVDSIPAVLAVTRDPLIVYTSNVFALLGLRSLYFVLSGAIRDLRFLRPGLGLMLTFIATKMLLGDRLQLPAWTSLLVIALIFGVAIALSLLLPEARRGRTTR
jgi:tellurite resistance protein TerC